MAREIWAVGQFEFWITRRHPEEPAFLQRAEGSPVAHGVVAGDPFGKLRAGSSLRLKNGYAQDDKVV